MGNVVANDSGPNTVTDYTIVGDIIKSGSILGFVGLGDGDDKFNGGANPEKVLDDKGADIVNLGGGSDTYVATGAFGNDGIDTVRGSAGIDTYDASAATSDLLINLDSVTHSGQAANTASGTDISGTAKDMIFGFENARGGANHDFIFGSAAANQLDGNGSGDHLTGLGGSDTLFGGAGIDTLNGGAGKDLLVGGADLDSFEYSATTDSGITAATRDLILDFEDGIDIIDLTGC